MILVTGGAGFIGSNFVLNWLARCDEPVLNLDKLSYAGNLDNLKSLQGDDRHIFIHGDICDLALVKSLIARHRPRAIINFAAESHVDRSITDGEDFVQTNVLGVFRLLEAVRVYWNELTGEHRSAFRFVQISTDEVYGSLGPDCKAFTEVNRYEPNSPYAASKASADHLVRASYRTYGLPVLTTNCANNYGPFQFPEKLIPLMITQALSERAMPVYGTGQQVRDWLYVADHCDAIMRVLEGGRPGETYNVGDNAEYTNIEVVRAICRLLDQICPRRAGGEGYGGLITHVPDRPGHDSRYAIDSGKIRRELGWSARHGFLQGLESTVRWYLDHRGWIASIQSRMSPHSSTPVDNSF